MSNVLIALVVLLVVFLVARSLVLWYWKVNAILSRLDSIASHLEYLGKLAKAEAERELTAREAKLLRS